MSKKIPVTFNAPSQSFIDRLDYIATREGRSRSNMLVWIVNEYLDDNAEVDK